MASARKGKDEPTVIKKYANRRLYDTGRSSYVTLDDLCQMVKEGHDFVVYDAKSGEDLTRSVLTQIIVDQESRGQNLLPVGFLRQLIGFYDDTFQPVVPNYLEYMMELFTKNQERMQEHIKQSFEASKQGINKTMGMFPGVPTLEEVKRQNMAMFEKAIQAFSPFGVGAANEDRPVDEKIRDLKSSIAEMEKELKRLSSKA